MQFSKTATMFQVMFSDESGDLIVNRAFILNSLPTIDQKVYIEKYGIYAVSGIILRVGEDVDTAYVVTVRKRESQLGDRFQSQWN